MADSLRCPGMRDMLPDEMGRFRRVEEAFREVCLGWGYQEVRTPTIEHLHLFTLAGTLSPQMLGRVYSFLDWDGWSGERVVLRPESTIPAARLYVEELRGQEVARLFYVQNVFRFMQGDQSREGWQCGVELMGDTQPEGDIELVLMGREVLERLGLRPQVRLSHPGILRSVLARAGFDDAEQTALYDRILDGDLSALAEVRGRLPEVGASLELLLGVDGEGVAYLNNVRSVFLSAIPDLERPLAELSLMVEALEGMGCRCQISAALVRNFEYYTGTVLHFQVDRQVVGSGGRYDSLISLVGGEATPASGFALDATRLAEILAGQEETGERSLIQVRPLGRDASSLVAAFRVAVALRGQGWCVTVGGPDGRGQARWRVTAAPDGFTLGLGEEERRLDSVEAVVRVLGEAGRG